MGRPKLGCNMRALVRVCGLAVLLVLAQIGGAVGIQHEGSSRQPRPMLMDAVAHETPSGTDQGESAGAAGAASASYKVRRVLAAHLHRSQGAYMS